MLMRQISLIPSWYGATNAYSSNFLGQNAGLQQVLITQMSLVTVMKCDKCLSVKFHLSLVISNKCLKFHGLSAGSNASLTQIF
jgi:hypothetical protein